MGFTVAAAALLLADVDVEDCFGIITDLITGGACFSAVPLPGSASIEKNIFDKKILKRIFQ